METFVGIVGFIIFAYYLFKLYYVVNPPNHKQVNERLKGELESITMLHNHLLDELNGKNDIQ